MAHVIDARSSGGEIIMLGAGITPPYSNITATDPALGTIRYNPSTGKVEALLSINGGSAAWYALALES